MKERPVTTLFEARAQKKVTFNSLKMRALTFLNVFFLLKPFLVELRLYLKCRKSKQQDPYRLNSAGIDAGSDLV